MIKKLTPENLPEELTPSIINVLVEMVKKTPREDYSWENIAIILKNRGQLDIIMDIVSPVKRYKKEELPEELTEEFINSLAYMAEEFPSSTRWDDICKSLSDKDLLRIENRRSEIHKQQEEIRRLSLSEEERKKEDDSRQRMLDNPFEFYGNMGRPETKEEWESFYKAKEEFDKMKKQ